MLAMHANLLLLPIPSVVPPSGHAVHVFESSLYVPAQQRGPLCCADLHDSHLPNYDYEQAKNIYGCTLATKMIELA